MPTRDARWEDIGDEWGPGAALHGNLVELVSSEESESAETGTAESEPLFQFPTVRSMWPAHPSFAGHQLLYERRHG
jgi:hypothetical protein